MSNDRKIAWDIEQQEIESDVPYANYHWIQSLKPTQPLEKVHHKRNFILQPWIFRSYVSFKEGTCICLATLGHVSSWIHTTRTWKGLVWSSFGVNDILLKGTFQNNCKLKNATSQYSCQIYLWVNSQTSPTSKFDGKNNWILSLRLYSKSNVYLKRPVDKPRSVSSIWGIYQFWKTPKNIHPGSFSVWKKCAWKIRLPFGKVTFQVLCYVTGG